MPDSAAPRSHLLYARIGTNMWASMNTHLREGRRIVHQEAVQPRNIGYIQSGPIRFTRVFGAGVWRGAS